MKDEYEVAGILASDSEHDLAPLSVPGIRAPRLSLGNSSRVAVGDEVYVVGNPRGLEETFSQGIVSALRKVDSKTLIQITAPISPGSSGGPVLNSRGEVVRVARATLQGGQNLNFAVPAAYLQPLFAGMRGVRPLFADAGRIERPRVPQKLPESKVPAPGEQSKRGSHFQRCRKFSSAEKFDEAEPECRAAIAEYREVLRLNPKDWYALQALDFWYNYKQDWDGEIAELCEVLRLDPKSESTHSLLGEALGNKGDWDAGVAAEREALLLNPRSILAHYNLGLALEIKGDQQGALQEYRTAYELDTKNDTHRQAYERILQQLNH